MKQMHNQTNQQQLRECCSSNLKLPAETKGGMSMQDSVSASADVCVERCRPLDKYEIGKKSAYLRDHKSSSSSRPVISEYLRLEKYQESHHNLWTASSQV